MPSGEPVDLGGPVSMGRAPDHGDLKTVRGIGPKVEARLKSAGIKDLGELARTPVNELAAVLAGLPGKFGTDRIVRERWLAQAAALAASCAAAELNGDAAATAGPVRHSFTVEVRMPLADRDIVSSKVVHVQTADEETWTGWDPGRIVAFIEDRSRVRRAASPAVRPGTGSGPEPGQQPEMDTGPQPGQSPGTPPAPRPEEQPGPAPTGPAPKPASENRSDAKAVVLHTYAMVPTSGPGTIGSRTGAVTATLTFDPATLGLSPGEVATVRADVFARQLPTGGSVPVGGALATVSPRERVRLDIPCGLSAVRPPATLFAVVRVLAGDGEARRPARGLADARLVISRTADERSAARPRERSAARSASL
jgi:hypothetical protein